MADPYVPHGEPSLIEALGRDAMHEEDLQKTILWLRDQLGQEGIPFAVIGALALRVNGYSRFTEDVDLVTTREGLARIHERLVGRGLTPRSPGLRKRLRNTLFRVDVDVIAAGEHAGSKESPIRFPEPTDPEFSVRKDGVTYASLPLLVTLKIAAVEWGHRSKDVGDVVALIQANRLDESFAGQLPEPVRARFRELVEASRREIDITDE